MTPIMPPEMPEDVGSHHHHLMSMRLNHHRLRLSTSQQITPLVLQGSQLLIHTLLQARSHHLLKDHHYNITVPDQHYNAPPPHPSTPPSVTYTNQPINPSVHYVVSLHQFLNH